MNTFFILQLYRQKTPYRSRQKDKDGQGQDYPHYELTKVCEGIYLSLEKAEAAMHTSLNSCGWKIYCCYIAEVPVETMVRDILQNNYSLRMYDGKGEKLDERLFISHPFANCLTTSENYGRRPEECRFKQGDVVEYIDSHDRRGVIGVVERIILERRDTPIGDDTDDGYLIRRVDESADNIMTDEYGEPNLSTDYIRCTEVFAPHYPIPGISQRRIENIREFIKRCGNNQN